MAAMPDRSLVESSLEVEELDSSLFRSTKNLWRPVRARGVFGGQVVGQALMAVTRTAPEGSALFSLHAHFLRAGDPDRDILYRVWNLRDGRSFSQRHVIAQQQGRPIFAMMASFQKPEESTLEHQQAAPQAPPPDDLRNEEQRYDALLASPRLPDRFRHPVEALRDDMRDSPIEIRRTTPLTEAVPERQLAWMRTRTRLADDPNLHRCALAFASDFLLLGSALRSKARSVVPAMMASLDHAMYFHAPFRFDEWLLYHVDSPRAHGGRALCHGYVYTQRGELVASVTQEGVIRLPAPDRTLKAADSDDPDRGEDGRTGGGSAQTRAKL